MIPNTPLRAEGTGNGITVNWPYNWLVEDKSHLQVIKVTIATGVEEILTVDLDYSVTGISAGSGYVVVNPAMTSDYRLVILPNMPEDQQIDFTNENSVPPKRVELGLDRVILRLKQLSEKLSRAVTLPPGSDQTPENYLAQMAQIYSDVLDLENSTQVAKTAAESAATNAGTSATNAGNSATLAQKWAAEAVDVVVSGGQYSAYHWAQKAALASGLNSGANSKHFYAMADGAGLVEFRNPLDFTLANGAVGIPGGTDFDTIMLPGDYRKVSTVSPNEPTTGGGMLRVFLVDTLVIQYFYGIASTMATQPYSVFRRTYNGTSWSAWVQEYYDIPATWNQPQRGKEQSVSYAASLTLNFSQANNYVVGALTGNMTLAAPSNATVGQSGVIEFSQDATGGRTVTYNAVFKFPNGNKVAPDTTAGAVSRLAYYVRASNLIDCVMLPKLS